MNRLEIVLASASPRRQELLRQVGAQFRVKPSQVDEQISEPMQPGAMVEYLALAKARDVAATEPGALVLGSDTIVVVDDQVLGKPKDRADAIAMLQSLSGRSHQVMTGVALIAGGRELVGHEVTTVYFRPLSLGEIERYVDSGEPMDKAGAYGIQGRAGAMISAIEGDYFTVVGLPLCRTVSMLAQFGVNVL
ncbi:MAG TPA: Maf family protein [Symbiobacteriaceae bacterium]|nr:Maf family protein [Symbiobacteriaceae bacterium]